MLLETQSPEDMVQNLWVEVTSINKACNDKLFPSQDVTARVIQTGEYINLLQELLPTLHLWRDRLDKSKGSLWFPPSEASVLSNRSCKVSKDFTVNRSQLLS